jgi:ParB/RepB/Spo0J family partition protein
MNMEISVSDIEPNQFNPNVMPATEFESLCQEMKQAGDNHNVISSILVSPKMVFYSIPESEVEKHIGKYVIVDGEWRWKGALGTWLTIPCEVQAITEAEAKAINYRKNKERGTIDPLREAALFKNELATGLTQDQVATKYGISQPYIANRLRLVKLNVEVVKVFQNPQEKFKEITLSKYEEELKEWNKKRESSRPGGESWYRPSKPEKEDLIPHGILSPSHLEAISLLPEANQTDVARHVLARGLTAKQTEEVVQREKREIAEKREFDELLTKAITKTCPKCGQDPREVDRDTKKFRCMSYSCPPWDPMKTRKELEAEIEASKTKEEKQRIEQLRETFKEARENPSYIKLPETPEELCLLVKPWLLAKTQQLTEIDRISVYGKRRDKVMQIDFQPPQAGMQNMSLTFKVGKSEFGFNVERKDYKRENAKSRVNLGWPLKPTEKSREAIRRFFSETIKTDQDPSVNEAKTKGELKL